MRYALSIVFTAGDHCHKSFIAYHHRRLTIASFSFLKCLNMVISFAIAKVLLMWSPTLIIPTCPPLWAMDTCNPVNTPIPTLSIRDTLLKSNTKLDDSVLPFSSSIIACLNALLAGPMILPIGFRTTTPSLVLVCIFMPDLPLQLVSISYLSFDQYMFPLPSFQRIADCASMSPCAASILPRFVCVKHGHLTTKVFDKFFDDPHFLIIVHIRPKINTCFSYRLMKGRRGWRKILFRIS